MRRTSTPLHFYRVMLRDRTCPADISSVDAPPFEALLVSIVATHSDQAIRTLWRFQLCSTVWQWSKRRHGGTVICRCLATILYSSYVRYVIDDPRATQPTPRLRTSAVTIMPAFCYDRMSICQTSYKITIITFTKPDGHEQLFPATFSRV